MAALRDLLRWGLAAASCGWIVSGAAAHAAIFTVNSRADLADAVPGDGICATASGVCTLRAAVQETNALAGEDTINLPPGVYGLTAGELAISDDLDLSGAGSPATVLKSLHPARTLSTTSGATVTIEGVRVQGGRAELGGGLFNNGTTTLTNVAFVRNRALSPAFGLGAAINNAGTLTLSHVTFSGNRATGGAGAFGGGIYNTGALDAADVSFTTNFSNGCGGALYNYGGSTTLLRATIGGNRVSNSGGGIFNQSGSVDVTAATLSHNLAKESGGAIFTYGEATFTNVTVTANRAAIGAAVVSGSSAAVTFANATVNGNRGTQGGSLFCNSGSITVHNSIIAFNRPRNCDGTTAMTSFGYNIDSGSTCGFAAMGDLNNLDPQLGVLRNNGGATRTCALLPGSPAIDAGDNAGCPPTDQRGDPRPAGAVPICDMGAYEVQP